MWLNELSKRWLARPATDRPALSQAARRRSLRLGLEQLEDRLVPSSFMAATVTDLIADINAANRAGGSNMITLTAPTTAPYNLTAVNTTTDGATGLPVVAANDNLTILGNGDTIARSTASGTPAFRLLDVAAGASLTLANLTLQGGLAFGAGRSAEGGAIYNQGALDLIGVTVQDNVARGQNGAAGQAGQAAAGGGLFSSGSLTLEGGTTVQNNQAVGGNGGWGRAYFNGGMGWVVGGGPGGNGFGGGLYVSSGSAILDHVTLSSNIAQGGVGGAGVNFFHGPGHGGNGFGGGLFASGGTITLREDSVTQNTALAGAGGLLWHFRAPSGLGEGGGFYINTLATVYLDPFTVANVLNNTASTSDPNIHGSYNLLP